MDLRIDLGEHSERYIGKVVDRMPIPTPTITRPAFT